MSTHYRILEFYRIGSDGSVINFEKQRNVSCFIDSKGYINVRMFLNGKRTIKRLHRLMMVLFYPVENMEKLTINHKDGNKANNDLSNLEWCTRAENTKHGHRTKLINNFGEKNGRAKLTESDIFKIRVLANIGHKHRSLSEQFKVSKSNIDKIVKMKIWKNIATS